MFLSAAWAEDMRYLYPEGCGVVEEVQAESRLHRYFVQDAIAYAIRKTARFRVQRQMPSFLTSTAES